MKKENNYKVVFGGATITKKEAQRAGVALIFGMIGIVGVSFIFGLRNKIGLFFIAFGFAVVGYFFIARKIYK